MSTPKDTIALQFSYPCLHHEALALVEEAVQTLKAKFGAIVDPMTPAWQIPFRVETGIAKGVVGSISIKPGEPMELRMRLPFMLAAMGKAKIQDPAIKHVTAAGFTLRKILV